LVPRILDGLKAADVNAAVVVGGIVSDSDAQELRDAGVLAVYTPKDFALAAIMADLLGFVEAQ
jgi:(2R)-ethylmalonyl-CoA mutase